ncbi:MAG TPA: hypothetical protein VNW29_01830, partial [Candidatus Sulfotelmatobacter sp.]|nr:hypothetical protein [Candidatus Sulfotelmatobacter sp.]
NGILNALIQPLSIRIFTTHLTSDVVHDLSPKDKYYSLIRNQSQEAAEEINRYTKKNELLILTGDFNIAKHSSLYREFLERSQLYDVFKDINNPTYSTNRIPYFYVAKLADSIDNIFISCPVKFKPIIVEQIFSEQATLSGGKKSYLSDHVALHCILEINEK